MRKLVVFLVLTIGARASADGYYGQNFSAMNAGSTSLSLYGWNGYYGTPGTAPVSAIAGTGTSAPNSQVSGGGSAPSITQSSNASEPVTTPTYGIAFFATPSNANQYLLESNVTETNPATFDWYQAGATGDSQRLAIEIGTQWYLSNTVFTVLAANTTASASSAMTKSVQNVVPFTMDAGSWSTFDFPNTFTVGADSALPSSTISAFGVYETQAASGSDKNFVDSFEVDVPEPVLAAPIFAMLVMLRKRRR